MMEQYSNRALQTQQHRHVGVVKYWSTKGFGFIGGEDGGGGLFVHVSNILDGGMLKSGDRVAFDAEPDKQRSGRLQAVRVELVEPTP